MKQAVREVMSGVNVSFIDKKWLMQLRASVGATYLSQYDNVYGYVMVQSIEKSCPWTDRVAIVCSMGIDEPYVYELVYTNQSRLAELSIWINKPIPQLFVR